MLTQDLSRTRPIIGGGGNPSKSGLNPTTKLGQNQTIGLLLHPGLTLVLLIGKLEPYGDLQWPRSHSVFTGAGVRLPASWALRQSLDGIEGTNQTRVSDAQWSSMGKKGHPMVFCFVGSSSKRGTLTPKTTTKTHGHRATEESYDPPQHKLQLWFPQLFK